jgi:hypothetical protein
MVAELYILRGLPGSGKSTLVELLRDNGQLSCLDWLSTDRFWIRPNGDYDFNPKLIGKAHDWNFGCFKWSMSEHNINPPSQIVIDNTDTTYWEFKKYIEHAVSVNPSIKIILLEPATPWKFDAEKCAEKNTHNVPPETIVKMLNRWEKSEDIAEKIRSEFGVEVVIQIGAKV